jgi:hypothetical protein
MFKPRVRLERTSSEQSQAPKYPATNAAAPENLVAFCQATDDSLAIGGRSFSRTDRPNLRDRAGFHRPQGEALTMSVSLWRPLAVAALVAFSAAAASSAYATKKAVAGPVSFDVPDDFVLTAGPRPSLHEEASGITLEVSELPPQAVQEFKGNTFLEYLLSLGYTHAAYAKGALNRTDAHTYVIADAKGKNGPESRFLLVISGAGRAAIVTAYVPKTQIDSGHASRAGIETILSSAAVVPAPAKAP